MLNSWAVIIVVNDHDRQILRELGSRMAELASHPIEKIKLWTAIMI